MPGSDNAVPLPSRIASLVHAHFDALPARSKPSIFPDGSREWIPMTGIVIVVGENTPSESLHCIAVTSGAKCLSASNIPRCRGLVLHDCHAEILAMRAFNHWLLTECHGLLAEEKEAGKNVDPSSDQEHADSGHEDNPASSSQFIRRRKIITDLDVQLNVANSEEEEEEVGWPPFELQPNIKIYMYCTCAPCGDASMELCMASQEDATPWEVIQHGDKAGSAEVSSEKMLDGRAHFSLLGVVRRKPARTDAESTRSKSCSDKLALRQVSSLLSSETSRLIAPTESAYLAGLVLPEDEISRSGCERSFGETGRMKALAGRSWPGITSTASEESLVGYRFRPFKILSVPAEQIQAQWAFAKMKKLEVSEAKPAKKNRPGNVSAVWTAASSYSHSCAALPDTGSKSLPMLNQTKTGLYENIINGVKQGNRATTPLARGASSLSRAKLWGLVRNIVEKNTLHCDGVIDSTSMQRDVASPGTSHLDNNATGIMHKQVLQPTTYGEFKRARSGLSDPNRIREEAMNDAKAVLQGWVSNSGDESWGLEVLIDSQKRKR